MKLLQILINILIIGLFLFSKLLPYKDNLHNPYKDIFNFFGSVYTPIFNFLKQFINPFQVGQGISVDLTQIVLLLILLFINFII
jgi:uncharacterized protein YggT (Ycf19 family)